MMTQLYIVTESHNATIILERLLFASLGHNVKFVACDSYDSAQNIAGNLLLLKRRPVVLVLDADSVDPESIGDRRVNNEGLLRFSAVAPFKVILAIPEIEILLFQDRAILEELLDCEISAIEWARAEFIPRTILQKLLNNSSHPMTLEALLDQLTPAMIDKLRHHPLLQEITTFLMQAPALQPVLA